MTITLAGLIEKAIDKGYIELMFRNRLSQFVDFKRSQPYLGALLLPETIKEKNEYEEFDLQFETIIADDTNRFDPPIKKKRGKRKSIKVTFGHFNIGISFQAHEVEELDRLLKTYGESDAMDYLLELIDKLIRVAIADVREKHRFEALIEAKQKLIKADGGSFVLNMENPVGHRVAANGTWSDNTYNPVVDDIVPAIDFLEEKGFTIRGMFSRKKVRRILQKNEQVRKGTRSDVDQIAPGRATDNAIRQYIADQVEQDDLPPLATYNRFYKTQKGDIKYFMPDNALLIACNTPRDYQVAVENGEDLVIKDTVGYFAIGKVMNEETPGDFVQLITNDRKPIEIEAEGFSAGAAVIQESEALFVIGGIA